LIRQAAVIGLSLVPFALSIVVAFLAWEAMNGVEAWRMIATTLTWIVGFAFGTQLFWKGVERLAPKRQA
jgi:hypothetical protein